MIMTSGRLSGYEFVFELQMQHIFKSLIVERIKWQSQSTKIQRRWIWDVRICMLWPMYHSCSTSLRFVDLYVRTSLCVVWYPVMKYPCC